VNITSLNTTTAKKQSKEIPTSKIKVNQAKHKTKANRKQCQTKSK
jgi:hypothetical protein